MFLSCIEQGMATVVDIARASVEFSALLCEQMAYTILATAAKGNCDFTVSGFSIIGPSDDKQTLIRSDAMFNSRRG